MELFPMSLKLIYLFILHQISWPIWKSTEDLYPCAALATAIGSAAHELPFRSLARRDLSRAGPFL